MRVFWLYGSKKFKPRVKSELRKQQYTVTLLDCNHLARGIVLWQIKNIMCYCTVFNLFYFVFEGNFQVQAPGGLIFGGAIKWKVVLRYEFVYLQGA